MSSFAISQIKLKNYRQFVDTTINLRYSEGKKNISIIEGDNGLGKSNIFNAINWCLFENEAHLGRNSEGMPLCNTSVLKALKENSHTDVSVQILFDTPTGKLEISRTIKAYKNSDGHEHLDASSTLQASRYTGKGNKDIPNPEDTISRILPPNMSHFFFIDGEQLRTMFNKIDKEEIRDAIFELSQINMLQSTVDHLSALKDEFRPKQTSKTERVALMCEQLIDESKAKISKWSGEYAAKKAAMAEAKKRKQQIDTEQQNMGLDELKKLAYQRAEFEQKIPELQAEIEEQEAEYFKYLSTTGIYFIFQKALSKTLKEISILEKEKRIPPKIDLEYLKELIENEECMCGCSLKGNKDALKRLNDIAADMKMAGFASLVSDIKYAIRDINSKASAKETKERFFQLPQKIAGLNEKLADTQKTLDEISKKIGNQDEKRVENLENMRRTLEEQIRSDSTFLGILEAKISKEKDSLSRAEAEYKKILASDKKNKLSLMRMAKCDEAISALNKLKGKLMSEIREDAEKHTREYFAKLINAKDFVPPEITEEYELRLKNRDGFNAIHNLSAAETLCMGYSFMAALRKTSGFMAPIVIDTPLAKIDKKYRLNVADWIKKALPDAQVILLVTDSEYTQDFAAELSSQVSDTLKIVHDRAASTSEVKNV